MNREQIIEKAAEALCEVEFGDFKACSGRGFHISDATVVVDAILPQISTVDELRALPPGTVLVSAGGTVITRTRDSVDAQSLLGRAAARLVPLTAVWQPQD